MNTLWKIVSETLTAYRDPTTPQFISIAFALLQYQAMLALTDGLSAEMDIIKSPSAPVFVFQ